MFVGFFVFFFSEKHVDKAHFVGTNVLNLTGVGMEWSDG